MVLIIQNGDSEGSVVGAVEIAGAGISDEKYYFCEDFDQEVAAVTLDAGLHGDEWTFGGTNGDAADVTYIAGSGGVVQLQTDGADDDSVGAYWITTNILVNSNPIIEFRFRLGSVGASDMACLLGLTETVDITTINNIDGVSNDYIAIGINSDLATPAIVRLFTNDATGGDTVMLTGQTLVVDQWCTVRIDCTDTEQPRVYVNVEGGAILPTHEIAAALITGTIQAGIAMIPFIFVQSLDVGSSAADLEVDYIKIWQDRA